MTSVHWLAGRFLPDKFASISGFSLFPSRSRREAASSGDTDTRLPPEGEQRKPLSPIACHLDGPCDCHGTVSSRTVREGTSRLCCKITKREVRVRRSAPVQLLIYRQSLLQYGDREWSPRRSRCLSLSGPSHTRHSRAGSREVTAYVNLCTDNTVCETCAACTAVYYFAVFTPTPAPTGDEFNLANPNPHGEHTSISFWPLIHRADDPS